MPRGVAVHHSPVHLLHLKSLLISYDADVFPDIVSSLIRHAPNLDVLSFGTHVGKKVARNSS